GLVVDGDARLERGLHHGGGLQHRFTCEADGPRGRGQLERPLRRRQHAHGRVRQLERAGPQRVRPDAVVDVVEETVEDADDASRGDLRRGQDAVQVRLEERQRRVPTLPVEDARELVDERRDDRLRDRRFDERVHQRTHDGLADAAPERVAPAFGASEAGVYAGPDGARNCLREGCGQLAPGGAVAGEQVRDGLEEGGQGLDEPADLLDERADGGPAYRGADRRADVRQARQDTGDVAVADALQRVGEAAADLTRDVERVRPALKRVGCGRGAFQLLDRLEEPLELLARDDGSVSRRLERGA